MCNAFSGLVTRQGSVKWEFGIDSHTRLVEKFALKDYTHDRDKLPFARFEIAPANGDYLKPDKWEFRVDEDIMPTWFKDRHEKYCWSAWKEWKAKLDKILVYKEIINPFEDRTPPKKINKKHIELLKEWNSVRNSVYNPVWASVEDSVRASVGNSVGASVWDSVWAYIGTFFKISKWEHIEHKKGVYPFQSLADLWDLGLVPSFDGETWRLHGGKDAKILYEIKKEDLIKR